MLFRSHRISGTKWPSSFDSFTLFKESPYSLTRWAPIADEYKARDKVIAENSVSFAWIEVRKDFLHRLRIST